MLTALIDDERDRITFKSLYDAYADDVFKRIYRLVNNRQDAEDIMQETWLSVAKNIKFYRAKDSDSIRSYILRIAKYQSITFYNEKQKRNALQCETELEEIIEGDDENLLFSICAKTDVAVIRECIDSLDEIYSDVLNFYYLHDYSTKEISNILKLKEVTVRARLSRGRAKLLQLLDGRNLNDR